ncbi:MAG: hypothetical protein GX924_07260 [Clostridiaceae bacterium]|nr:hypothetical protein [Clostridiaceae bacterium]
MEKSIRTQDDAKQVSKQEYVCPFCLRNMEKGTRCVCNTPGTIRTPEQTVQSRIERLTPESREYLIKVIELCEAREVNKKVEPEVLTYQTTPPATGIHADTDNSLSDDDKKTRLDVFLQLKYGILRLENCALISEAARALLATIERITNDSGTECLLYCIETKLQVIYEDLEDARRDIIKAFNDCFPSHKLSI